MMITRQPIALLLLATAVAARGSAVLPEQKRRSVQGMGTTSAPSPAKVGTNYCTDAPDKQCYPSTNGFPACCASGECPTSKQPCENATPSVAPAASSPSSTGGGGGMPGDSYCTYAPDFTCYKGGWPACCLVNLDTCPTTQPGCDKNQTAGGDYCTYAPDYNCYVDGWPMCCKENNGANCPAEQPSCDDASDAPSTVPAPSSGGLPSALPTPERAGSSYCTFSPDTTCYPSTNGFPACCSSDPTTCPVNKPACESSGPTAPTTGGATSPTVPSPSPVAPTSPSGGGSPTAPTSAAMGMTRSSSLALAVAAITGVAVVHIGAN